ncbi:alpha-L-rhamnosidase N-terminal domain-containing protein [Candidatus Enterococcus testudinis]|uniref:alpha-L-rhamnosidase N-terminal domain-containing protein n=1 Tax=Candidatus Enterococcus testudinis TaxID=1834191 RepID=UPI001C4E638C|nr:alpha-L-rhamnosidase N-terminal domain-containing protein [Enterococcus sp. 8G7_MSG3316]
MKKDGLADCFYTFNGKWVKNSITYDYGEEDKNYYNKNPHTLIRKKFMVETFKNSRLLIAVLGYYLCYINGHRVGDYELNSDWTNYKKRVYYDEYDVSSYLIEGENEITIELGNGMYNPSPLRLFGKYNLRERLAEIGESQIVCDLYIDGQLMLLSDESWESSAGNLIFNNAYLGEMIDLDLIENPWL